MISVWLFRPDIAHYGYDLDILEHPSPSSRRVHLAVKLYILQLLTSP